MEATHRRLGSILVFLIPLLISGTAQAVYQFDFDIFTSIGTYYDDPGVDMYMVVSNGAGQVDFTFYNISSLQSSLAKIYFDDGSLLGVSDITNGPGTLFYEDDTPSDLPGGELIGFQADREFTIGADNPPPENGVNPPDEWVTVHFDLVEDGTLEGVVQELYDEVLRVGIHIIDLPDGSSESAG